MKYLIIAFIFIVNTISAQTKPAVKKTTAQAKATTQKIPDQWEELDKTFVAFIKALETNNKEAYKAIALPQVDCVDCPGGGEQGVANNFVPSEIFFITVATDFNVSPVYKALLKRGYAFNSMVLKDFKPSFLPKDYPKDLTVYEVWVPTYKKDELSKGHQGTSHAFQFIKVNDTFRFFGLTSQSK